jgi:hypothetical protein
MNARANIHSSLIALTFALGLAACSSPNLSLTGTDPAGTDPAGDENSLSVTPEATMDTSSDAETAAALASGFGGFKTFGVASADSGATEAHVDGAGNVYVVGGTTAAFGGQSLSGGADAFLIKFNSVGVQQWVRFLGTPADENAIKVVPTPNGSVIVAGTTSGSLFASNLDPARQAERKDLFLTKFTPDGRRLWGIQFGSRGTDLVSDLRVDANGNSYIAGATYDALVGVNGATGKGVFVIGANPKGSLRTATFYNVGNVTQTPLTTGAVTVSQVKLDRALNVYASTSTNLTEDFLGSPSAIRFEKTLTKFLADGSQQFQLSSGVHGYKQAWAYLADSNGVTYLTGETMGYADFFKRYDNGLETYSSPFGNFGRFAIAAQSTSNTETLLISDSEVIKLGAGGLKINSARLTSSNPNDYVQLSGLNLDKTGNVFVVGSRDGRDADGNFLEQQPFIAKYNPKLVLQ